MTMNDSSGVMKVADFNGDGIPDVLSGTDIIFNPEDPANPNTGTGLDRRPQPAGATQVHARQGADASGGAGH